MADTINQQIINAVDAQLKKIKKDNDYRTNAGANVVAWSINPVSDEDLPLIDYKFAVVEGEIIKGRKVNKINLEIRAIVKNDGITIDSRELKKTEEDIKDAMNKNITWGKLAIATNFVSSEIFYEQVKNLTGICLLKYQINYIN